MIQSLTQSFRHMSLFRLTGIILFLLFILSETVTLPGFILTILALLWILYIPFSIGDLFVAIPIKPIKSLSNYINGVGVFDVLIKWFIGLLLIILFAFPASISHLFIANILGPILLLMAIPLNLRISRNKKTEVKKVDKQIIIKILVFSLILGISFGTFIRFFSPYPLTPGFDTFSHMYVIKSFLNGSVDTNTVVYLPTFHLLVALGSATFNADVIEIFWTASIILSSLFAVSLYATSYWVSRNHMIAFVGSFIGLAITEMGMSPNIQVFVPSSFVMSIFPITFIVVDVIWKRSNANKKLPIILTLVVFSGLVLIHYELGLAAAFVLSLYLVSLYIYRKMISSFF